MGLLNYIFFPSRNKNVPSDLCTVYWLMKVKVVFQKEGVRELKTRMETSANILT